MNAVREVLAPHGVLRCGINLSNFLLVQDKAALTGISPSIATEIAKKLDANLEMIPYRNPGALTLAARSGDFGLGLVANEPQRAEVMLFSPPYCEIDATLLVRGTEQSLQELDRPDASIAVAEGAAYDLYLSRTLAHASLRRAKGLDASFDLYCSDQSIAALAGLRPKLNDYAPSHGKVLETRFTAIAQSIGVPRLLLKDQDQEARIHDFLTATVKDVLASGLITKLITDFGHSSSLTPAAADERKR